MLLSSASTACRFVMLASSHRIREAMRRSLAVPLCLVKLHDAPSSMLSGILNLEWAVRPPGMMEGATPEVAVATAILPSPRTFARSALYRKVFPVPPGPSTKNTPPSPASTAARISSYASLCSWFSEDPKAASCASTSMLDYSVTSLASPPVVS